MKFHIEKREKIKVPCVLNAQMDPIKGKDSIEYVEVITDIAAPVILTSDLHHNALELMDLIAEKVQTPREFIFISAGDMAGTGIIGSNGDPTMAIEKASSYFKKVFFVNGNHDQTSSILQGKRNADKSNCHLHNRVQSIDSFGTIAGVDGIISRKKLLHRIPKQNYIDTLHRVVASSPQWLITHEIPEIPEITNKSSGDFDLRELVINSGVRFHVFGHHSFKNFYGTINNTTFINVDSRVICMRNS
ncbi:metallophosphoesterase [Candidatus Uabimicrobium sp. HlEnr_7]|uniref:metallophosphoesterase family protein n=1 Tax=Candidatus Uabimicrobium helgolandensis TaxID=3095367 RepID=UPI003555EC64